MPKRILIVGPKCTANNKVILFKSCGELSLFLQYTANILLLKIQLFIVFSHALPVPFWHLITVQSTADIQYFHFYFWKKNHIIQTVVRTLKAV